MENRIKIFCNDSYKNKILGGKEPLITFFTPTYNRANFLARIEDCLLNQTCKDFVWIIVNDGSRDNTNEVAAEILHANKIPVKYISKPNGGKHSAFQTALGQCETAYFQCMDDDDIYFPDAVDFYLRKWKEIKAERREDIGAIRTLSKREDGRVVANFEIKMDEEYDASTIETNYVKKHSQENWTCYDTEKLKSVNLFKPYWMSEQHKFVMESIWQTRFARKYKCRYVNKVFREYRTDDNVSLSRSDKSHQHWVDVFLNEKVKLDEQYDLMKSYCGAKDILKSVLLVNFMRDYLGIGFNEMVENTTEKKVKQLYYITWLPSLFGKQIMSFVIMRSRK